MIVADKEKSLKKADEIAIKILDLITEETKDFQCEDDPAEHSYLAVHAMGNIIARICMSLEGYGNIYGIPNMTSDAIQSWIHIISNEYLKINKELHK
jgi:hypothetical protein